MHVISYLVTREPQRNSTGLLLVHKWQTTPEDKEICKRVGMSVWLTVPQRHLGCDGTHFCHGICFPWS